MSNALATEAATSEVQDPRTERRHDDNDSDDGFDDFLSEEEEESTLQTQEMDALARKMKSVRSRVGVRWFFWRQERPTSNVGEHCCRLERSTRGIPPGRTA
ncbi:hypothetical protein PINS_up013602 [Pythium insidiosum]|nr:hypothetical protein PINS_up013602 [Pythium insidiosum]